MVLNGTIKIVTDKAFYLPGDKISATIHLTINQEMKGEGKKLMIRWKGYEKSILHTHTWKSQGGTYNHHRDLIIDKTADKKEMFNSASVVHTFAEGIPAGVHEYNVTFDLPKNIPGSGFFTNGEIYYKVIKGIILYKAKCWVDEGGTPPSHPETKKNIIKRVDRLIVSDIPQVAGIHETNSKSFLLSKGKLNLKVDMEKNYYSPGETIPVKVLVDNETGKKVEKLKVKLMRKLVIHSGSKSKEFTGEVLRKEYEGVDSKSKKDIVLDFKIDPKMCPSTNGQLLNCQYHIDVECDVAMAGDLEVHPVVVVAPTPQHGQPLFLYNEYDPKKWIPEDKI